MRRTRGGCLYVRTYVVLFARSRTVFQAMTNSFLMFWHLAIPYLVQKLLKVVDVRRSISRPLVFYFGCVSRIYSTITISYGLHLNVRSTVQVRTQDCKNHVHPVPKYWSVKFVKEIICIVINLFIYNLTVAIVDYKLFSLQLTVTKSVR